MLMLVCVEDWNSESYSCLIYRNHTDAFIQCRKDTHIAQRYISKVYITQIGSTCRMSTNLHTTYSGFIVPNYRCTLQISLKQSLFKIIIHRNMAESSKQDFEPDSSFRNCDCSSTFKPYASHQDVHNSSQSGPRTSSYHNEDSESWGFQDIPRLLTDDEKEKLKKDKTLVTEFKQRKLELEAEKNWDLFYKRNTIKFFKDRHWTKREFIDLVIENKQVDGSITVFEVGCGVGNFMFPLMEEDPSLKFIACDFSKRAVQFVKEHPQYDAERCAVFHCDATKDSLTDHILPNSVDLATMIFVLSAIHPDKMVDILKNVFQVLKPGGHLLFRDYGLYDYAMLRFAPGHKLEENFYVRQDGTRAYYFSKEKLESLVTTAGYEVKDMQYVHRETVNKKERLCVPRIFVQGKFTKHFVQDSVEHVDRKNSGS